MLLEFSVRNYRCIREMARLSLVASPDESLSTNTMASELPRSQRLLTSVVIYGANASGKSTVLSAIGSMRQMVTRSARVAADAAIPFADPFRLDSVSQSAPTEFEIVFAHRGVRYQYGFAVCPERVTAEWLYGTTEARQKRYYERSWDDDKRSYTYRFGPSLKGQRDRLAELTRDNALYLSTGATLNHELLTEVYSWFSTQLTIVDEHSLSLPALADFVQGHPENLGRVTKLLECADLGITDLSLQQVKYPEFPEDMPGSLRNVLQALMAEVPEKDRRAFQVGVHHSRKDGGEAIFALDRESDGTQRILLISPHVLGALRGGGVVLIDEISSSLHPLLTRALVGMFHDGAVNLGGAQLVCTSHDVSLLDMSVLRRDQVWFTEKDSEGCSHLYSLLEYKPRKEAAVGKGYLAGRYGAVPLVVPLLGELCESELV
ncbi:MAG: AAA family ATPase [Anaerolineae bacterium]